MSRLHFSILGALCLFLSVSVHAQTLQGVVTDDNGQPLPGASIIANGAQGVSSDIDGRYSLPLGEGRHSITCSFVGYVKVSQSVDLTQGQIKTINFQLETDAVLMDDVVVIGYGVQRKKEVTGSISQIDSKQITAVRTPSFEAALQGQAAGVQVSQSSGVAGAGSLIRVRGVASVSAAGDPLYVVDGIPITQDYFLRVISGALNNNPLATINPNDIESVDILKDAAATGIYGSRGANGVILITTKRGQNGTSYEFSSSMGLSTPASLPNMLNTEQYLTLRQEAWENDGGTGYVWLPGYTSSGDTPERRRAAFQEAMLTNTDWVSETVGIGVKHNYSFGARSGSEKHSLYAGVSYDDNGSYLQGNSYERISGRLNGDYTPNDWLKVMLSSSLSRGINNRIDAAWSGGLGDAMSNALPYYPVYRSDTLFNADGTVQSLPGDYFLYQDEWGGTKNPVAVRESKTWITTEDRSINNLSLILTPTDRLFIKGSGGFDYMHVREDIYNPPSIFLTSELGNANRYANYVLNWNYSLTADYKMDLSEFSKLNLLVGSEFQRTDGYG